jgi:hypothetical protein
MKMEELLAFGIPLLMLVSFFLSFLDFFFVMSMFILLEKTKVIDESTKYQITYMISFL